MGEPAIAFEALEARARSWPEQARALVITDAASYAQAADRALGLIDQAFPGHRSFHRPGFDDTEKA